MNEDLKPHILYVDDEENNLIVFKAAFRRYYHVHTALSAKEGLEILQKQDIKVILTDQRMPDITGIDFLKMIPDKSDLISMILTAYTDVQTIIEAVNIRMVYKYITKPWNKEELKQSIDNAVESLTLRQRNKKLTSELQELNERLNMALGAGSIGVWEWNIQTDNIFWSEQIEPMFGFSIGGFGKTYEAFLECVHSDDRGFVTDSVNKCLEDHSEYNIDHRIVWPDGQIRWVSETGKLYLDDAGKPSRILGVVRDINTRKNSEEELKKHRNHLEELVKERTKEIEAFTYSVSHDLRAPLRAISGFSEILSDEYNDKLDDEAKRLVKVISKNALNMNQLITDLLNFSRVGRQQVKSVKINMKDLANNVFDELTQSNPKHKINFKLGNIPPAMGDSNLIRIVFSNLISNAIKFSANEKALKIEIGSMEKDEQLFYYVKDNGVGFDMHYADKIFEVFQRLHASEEFEGTGVGLAIVKKIIQKHGRKVIAEGEVDKGATFYFSLPIIENS